MKLHRQALVEDFVNRHEIHRPYQHLADIGKLKPLFKPKTLPSTRLPYPAFAFLPKDNDPCEATPISVFLRRDLTEVEKRLGYVHEMMHWVLGHRGSIQLFKISPWFHERDEREAWEATAIVLIPERSFMESPNVRWLSRVCKVPEWLITLHPLACEAGLERRARSGSFR